jgi:hypothetical protein
MKIVAVLLLLAATIPPPTLSDAVKQKILAAYRLVQIRQTDLDTKRNNLCAVDKACMEAATKLNAATEELRLDAEQAGKDAGLPKDVTFTVDSDKGEVKINEPAKTEVKK